MKIMVIYDMASHSTRDCGVGIHMALVGLGHETFGVHTNVLVDILSNHLHDKPQNEWPLEQRGLIYGTMNKIILADAVINKPDAVIVVSGWVVSPLLVNWLRENKITTAIYLTESPYMDKEQMEIMLAYDVVFLNERSKLDYYRASHPNVYYLPHSYNPEIHKPVESKHEYRSDVYMCATGFRERMAIIEAVNWVDIDLKLAGFWPGIEETRFAKYTYNKPIHNWVLPYYYNSAKINLNINRTSRVWTQAEPGQEYIDPVDAESLGPRVYEILACGGFLMSDYRKEMDDFLVDGLHYVAFENPQDLEDKIRFYIGRPDERATIAAAGKEAVKNCSFASRCESTIIPAIKGVMQ